MAPAATLGRPVTARWSSTPDGTVLAERAASIGTATNNVAEYSGLIAGLEAALRPRRVAGDGPDGLQAGRRADVRTLEGQAPGHETAGRRASDLVARFDQVDLRVGARARRTRTPTGWPTRRWTRPPPAGSWVATSPSPRRRLGETGETGETEPDPAAALPAPRDGHPTRFLVVRHGETTWGAQARFAGRQDVPLTDAWAAAGGRGGRPDRVAGARGGADLPVGALPGHGARRSRAGARVRLVEDDRLLDGVLGEWTGLADGRDRGATGRRSSRHWRSDPDAAPPGGESFTEVRDRVRPLMTELLRSLPRSHRRAGHARGGRPR